MHGAHQRSARPSARSVDRGGIPPAAEFGAAVKEFTSALGEDAVVTDAASDERAGPLAELAEGPDLMQIFEGTNQIQRLVISRDLARG